MRALDALAWVDGRVFVVLLAVAGWALVLWIMSTPDVDDEDRDRGRCCSDPLCPCDYKPGWGPYAPAPGPVRDDEP